MFSVLLLLWTYFRESEKVFGSQGLHLKSLIKYVAPFCLVWMLTNYSYVRALGVIRAADVTALFSSCNAFVYVFSLIWLQERLGIVKVRGKIGLSLLELRCRRLFRFYSSWAARSIASPTQIRYYSTAGHSKHLTDFLINNSLLPICTSGLMKAEIQREPRVSRPRA